MENKLREAVNMQKDHLIEQLIEKGVYKKSEQHLYHLTVTELQREYYEAKQ